MYFIREKNKIIFFLISLSQIISLFLSKLHRQEIKNNLLPFKRGEKNPIPNFFSPHARGEAEAIQPGMIY